MFPLSATFSTLPDFEAIRGGKIEEVVGDLFNLFLFYEVLSHSFFFRDSCYRGRRIVPTLLQLTSFMVK